ncbi:MAG: sialidase family protein [Bacteroidota bacterium]
MKNYLLFLLSILTSLSFAQTHTELIVKNKIDHISTLAREPMVAEHPSGALFVTGYRNNSMTPQLWKSMDMGKTWKSVDVGTTADGAIGNSDVDLYIDAKGNIYLLSMTYTQLPEDMEGFDFSTMKGERIAVGVSKDAGSSWKWQTISENDYDDRPWITATTDGSLHIIWNDGKGVHHAVSKDEGTSWQKQADVSPKGGSSFLADGYNGQLAVRIAPLSASAFKMDEGVDLIRLSLDNGKSWKDVSIPGKRTWTQDLSDIPRWVEPLAWDKEDRLYLLSSEGKELKLSATKDNGKTWKEYIIAESMDTLYFPYMQMSEQGILCTWLSGFNENIRHHAAIVKFKEEKIQIFALEPLQLDVWSRFGGGDYERSTCGEYFPIIPLSNGNIGMVTTIQNSKANRLGFTWWELILNEF